MIEKINAWRDDYAKKRKERDQNMAEKVDEWSAIRRDKRANWFANNIMSRPKQYALLGVALGVLYLACKK